MSALPDPADLVAIAARIAAHAAATRDRAVRLDRAIATTGWTGTAAAAFHLEAQPATDALRTASARLDAAADALRRHAGRISGLLADVARLGVAELGLVEDVLVHPGQVLPDVAHVVDDGFDVVGDALDLIGL
jgi:hypothetical protein